jgi:hypothetical protein
MIAFSFTEAACAVGDSYSKFRRRCRTGSGPKVTVLAGRQMVLEPDLMHWLAQERRAA